MSQWLTGNTGVEKLALLNERFENLCLTRINKELNSNFSHYTPCMSLDKGRDKLPKILLEKQNILIKNNNYLSSLADFYTPPANQRIEGKNTVKFEFNSSNGDIFNSAIEFFESSSSFVVDVYKSIITNIVPMNTIEGSVRIEGAGNSNHESLGAIYLSVPSQHPMEIQLAINIAHEVGHQALMLYQTSDSIIIPQELGRNIYSAVRKTNRPAIQSFHALVALVFMRDFIASIDRTDLSQEKSVFIESQLASYNCSLKTNVLDFKNIFFTGIGNRIYEEIFEYVEKIKL